LMFRITPFIVPTRWSLVPKSVVSVMMGSAKRVSVSVSRPKMNRERVEFYSFNNLSKASSPVKAVCPNGYCSSVARAFSLRGVGVEKINLESLEPCKA
jgi:hypothetical protein